MNFIPADDAALQYMGRIDFGDPKAPIWVYPATCVRFRCTGTILKVDLTNIHGYYGTLVGIIVDGAEGKFSLQPNARETVTLYENLAAGEHDVLLYKRMDACHHLQLHGFTTDGEIRSAEPLPARRMEVYGDSVSAGEVCECIEYAGKADPPHDGQYSNSYYSYSWIAARHLNARLHDIAQGGIALLPGTGYFGGPNYLGMEEMYDKIQYNSSISTPKNWDFSRYIPHVVIVAIGQNDNHPEDYMALSYDHPDAVNWRNHYLAFVCKLRSLYPKATIILSTTILNHDSGWDDSIDAVCRSLNDPKVHHFLYTNNGCGTPGHIRIPEAEVMGKELADFITALGNEIWED